MQKNGYAQRVTWGGRGMSVNSSPGWAGESHKGVRVLGRDSEGGGPREGTEGSQQGHGCHPREVRGKEPKTTTGRAPQRRLVPKWIRLQ